MRAAVALSVAWTTALVSALAFLCTAGEALLPRVVLDSVHLSPLWPYAGAPVAAMSVVALIVLWRRHRSTLDLWLMVVMCLYTCEIPLSYYPMPFRFSIGWYSVRAFGFLSSTLVLIVLLFEIKTLYAKLLGAMLAQRREREARLMTGDAVAATIAHEVNQPLTSMVASADAGFRFLDRSVPNLERAKEAFQRIAEDGHRAGEVVGSIRAIFKTDARTRTPLDVNEIIREALALERTDLRKHRILVEAEWSAHLPEVRGDRVQVQQVLLNLITNAIHAMAAEDEPRVLCLKSEAHQGDGVIVSVADTGAGISARDLDRIFTPSSRPNPTAWGWACRFAARLSRPTTDGCRWPRTLPAAPYFSSRCTLERDLQRSSHSHQLGKRAGAHLLHDLATMNLDGDLADAELGRGLLVEQPGDDQRQDLALAGRQTRQAPLQPGQLGSLQSGSTIQRDGGLDGPYQVGLLEWLGQEVDRARLDRAYG
jgi:signal transduction histidine kinase